MNERVHFDVAVSMLIERQTRQMIAALQTLHQKLARLSDVVRRPFFAPGDVVVELVDDTGKATAERTIYVNEYPGGSLLAYPTKEQAEKAAYPERMGSPQRYRKVEDGLAHDEQ